MEPVHTFEQGLTFRLGPEVLTEADIIAFGQTVDPLPVHTDPEFAKTTRFGKLISSGFQPGNRMHQKYWLPANVHTLVCGIRMDVTFHKPLFADQPYTAQVTMEEVKHNLEKRQAVVVWCWEFYNDSGELLQTCRNTCLHRIP